MRRRWSWAAPAGTSGDGWASRCWRRPSCPASSSCSRAAWVPTRPPRPRGQFNLMTLQIQRLRSGEVIFEPAQADAMASIAVAVRGGGGAAQRARRPARAAVGRGDHDGTGAQRRSAVARDARRPQVGAGLRGAARSLFAAFLIVPIVGTILFSISEGWTDTVLPTRLHARVLGERAQRPAVPAHRHPLGHRVAGHDGRVHRAHGADAVRAAHQRAPAAAGGGVHLAGAVRAAGGGVRAGLIRPTRCRRWCSPGRPPS